MEHAVKLAPASIMPKSSETLNQPLAILSDEIRLAVEWNRPSILVVLHKSRLAQNRAVTALEGMLTGFSVEYAKPDENAGRFLSVLLERVRSAQTIFFIKGLGKQEKIYHELNLHREKIIENHLKLVFWLLPKELAALSHRAPDFWAFRHRVVEFPTERNPRQKATG